MSGYAGWLALSYLLGAIPTSLVAARWIAGVDLRQVGSGNLGATNLYRALGWKYAVPVGLFDMAKGAVPVMLFAPLAGVASAGALGLGAAAIVGHVFSVFVKFRGGKGVATSAGVVLGLAPLAFAVSGAVWALTVWASGYVSLGSVLAALAFPAAVALLYPGRPQTFWFGLVIAVMIVAFHQANIRRLVRGTENRFGRRRAGQGNGGSEGAPTP